MNNYWQKGISGIKRFWNKGDFLLAFLFSFISLGTAGLLWGGFGISVPLWDKSVHESLYTLVAWKTAVLPGMLVAYIIGASLAALLLLEKHSIHNLSRKKGYCLLLLLIFVLAAELTGGDKFSEKDLVFDLSVFINAALIVELVFRFFAGKKRTERFHINPVFAVGIIIVLITGQIILLDRDKYAQVKQYVDRVKIEQEEWDKKELSKVQSDLDKKERELTVMKKEKDRFKAACEKEIKPAGVQQEINEAGTALDMSDWQLYRNEEYRLEFIYPPDWLVTEQRKNGRIIVKFGEKLSDQAIRWRLDHGAKEEDIPVLGTTPIIIEVTKDNECRNHINKNEINSQEFVWRWMQKNNFVFVEDIGYRQYGTIYSARYRAVGMLVDTDDFFFLREDRCEPVKTTIDGMVTEYPSDKMVQYEIKVNYDSLENLIGVKSANGLNSLAIDKMISFPEKKKPTEKKCGEIIYLH